MLQSSELQMHASSFIGYKLLLYRITRVTMYLLTLENPSSLHTTPASLVDHPLSTTVPHVSLKQTSTRPSLTPCVLPFLATSLTSPLLQKTARKAFVHLMLHLSKDYFSNQSCIK